MMPGLGDAIRLSRSHEEKAEIGSERSIVCIDSVEGKIVPERKFEHLRARGFQLEDQRFVLQLRGVEVWGMIKS